MASSASTRKVSPFFIAVVLLVAAMVTYMVYSYQKSNPGLSSIMPAPNFTMNEINGTNFEMKNNTGKVMLLEFMFTSCPDICPITTYNMVLLQDKLKEEGLYADQVQFLSVTFDPETDTPEVLSKYAQRMNIDPSGWKLLRGDEEYTKNVAADYGISIQKLRDGQFVHSVTSLMLIDAKQEVRKVYKMGDEMDNAEILKDIRTLITG